MFDPIVQVICTVVKVKTFFPFIKKLKDKNKALQFLAPIQHVKHPL